MSKGNGALTKEAILTAEDRKVIPVDCPEWGGRVYIRPLSGEQRDELEERFSNQESSVGIRAWIAAAAMCDGEGKPMGFTPKEVDELGQKSAAPLDRVASQVQKISKMSNEDVEKLEGNSKDAQNADSG